MGNNFLKTPNKEKHCEDIETSKFRSGVASMQGWRIEMEDAHILSCKEDKDACSTSFFAVFDGHCGSEVAHFCAEKWESIVRNHPSFHTDLVLACRDSFFQLDQQLLNPEQSSLFFREQAAKQELAARKVRRGEEDRDLLAREVKARLDDGISKGALSSNEAFELAEIMQELEEKMKPAPSGGQQPFARTRAGCTAICACIRGKTLIVCNAGDSRAVLCRKRGEVLACSEDHKPNNETERTRICRAGGFVSDENRVNGQLALSRAIGDFDFKQNTKLSPSEQAVTCDPDVRVFQLEPTDEFLVLACDGIWDVLSNQECVDFLKPRLAAGKKKGGRAVSEAICELLERCVAPTSYGMGTDNMTCLVVQFKKL